MIPTYSTFFFSFFLFMRPIYGRRRFSHLPHPGFLGCNSGWWTQFHISCYLHTSFIRLFDIQNLSSISMRPQPSTMRPPGEPRPVSANYTDPILTLSTAITLPRQIGSQAAHWQQILSTHRHYRSCIVLTIATTHLALVACLALALARLPASTRCRRARHAA